MSIIGTALSGMRASQAKLSASASNVANHNAGPIAAPATFGPIGKVQERSHAYQPIGTEQSALPTGGLATHHAPASQPYILRYQPESFSADSQGMVATPNVDLAQEAAEQLAATQNFKANARIVQTADDMTRSTLIIWG